MDSSDKGAAQCGEPREANLLSCFSFSIVIFSFPSHSQFLLWQIRSTITEGPVRSRKILHPLLNISHFETHIFSPWISSLLNYHLLLYLLLGIWCLSIQLILYNTSNAWWYLFTLHISYNCQKDVTCQAHWSQPNRGSKCTQDGHGEESYSLLGMWVFFPFSHFFLPPNQSFALLRFIDLDLPVLSLTDFMATVTYFLFLLITRKQHMK